MIAFYLVAAFVAGALVTVQTGSNARLKEALGHPVPAVIISSALGIVALLAVMVVARIPVPSFQNVTAASWSAWLGGLLGALYAMTVVLLARSLGAGTLTVLLITGQLVCSVALDHFGLMGFEQHSGGDIADPGLPAHARRPGADLAILRAGREDRGRAIVTPGGAAYRAVPGGRATDRGPVSGAKTSSTTATRVRKSGDGFAGS